MCHQWFLDRNPPDIYPDNPPGQPPPDKPPRVNLCVSFFKNFHGFPSAQLTDSAMVNSITSGRLVVFENLLLHIHVVVVEEFKSTLV